MEVKDIMTRSVVTVDSAESVEIAARTMARHNIGALPVVSGGKLCGMLTDRDIVTRCLAANRVPGTTTVKQVMTEQVTSSRPDMQTGVAAHLMGRLQVRRLPVVENGKLVGIIALSDLARCHRYDMEAAQTLCEISENILRK